LNATEERAIGQVTVQIDRRLCVGFETCIEIAPEVFRFDGEGIATFCDTCAEAPSDLVVEACTSCPVDALVVLNEQGKQIVP
jgi:ferredoxin